MSRSLLFWSEEMEIEVIDATQWDQSPTRQILIVLLVGEAKVVGPLKDEILHAEHAGLLLASPLEEQPSTEGTYAWRVRPTLVGRSLALRISKSDELCEVLDCLLSVGAADWRGIDAKEIMAELDLRDGGTGHVASWPEWAVSRGRDYVSGLPRRLGGAP